jgi:hypothetical protein
MFALKGLEMRTESASEVRSRFWPHLAALSAIGTALMVMVYAGGHISGHHRYFDVWALSHFWVYLIGDSGRCRACEQRFFCTPIRSRISGSSESRGLWTGGRERGISLTVPAF